MSKFYDDINWTINQYPNAPCHTCIFRNGDKIGNFSGAVKTACKKYPVSRNSIGVVGKPIGILEGTKKCPFYKSDNGVI